MELDSHADTCVVGKNAMIVYDHRRRVSVTGYDPKAGSISYRIVSAAVAYDDPYSGVTSILIINQAIEIPHLDNHLLCIFQCRMGGVLINDVPKFQAPSPSLNTHAISVNNDEGSHTLLIPLSLRGVTSYFNVRKPTTYEWENYSRYELTLDEPKWDPSTNEYQEIEERMVNYKGEVVSTDSEGLRSDTNIFELRSNTVPSIDHVELGRRWGISPDKALRTVRCTTQRGIRNTSQNSLTKRIPTNDRSLRYRRLPHQVFADTLISGTTSRRGNKYAQVFATSFGWTRVYPMSMKGLAHEGLSLLFQRDGVPSACIVDGAKEQTQGAFHRKLREAACQLKQIEPHSPWQNAAEGAIRELKRGAARKMSKSGSPMTLWDDCLELESYIRSHTAHDIYSLNGQVPETIMSGETADISFISELGWYDWVKFRDTSESFPNDKVVLGRYLGPSMDVGPALTAKILKMNGTVVYRSTYRRLNEDERHSAIEQAMRDKFDDQIRSKVGPGTSANSFKELNIEMTPTYDAYVDDNEDAPEPLDEEIEPTPEISDKLLNAHVQLQKGNTISKGTVIERVRDPDGNVIGREHRNPILDTRRYKVKFDDGDVTELTANVIAESMYAQMDGNGNLHALLGAIIDHKRSKNAVTLSEQKVIKSGKTYIRRSTAGWSLCCEWKDGSTSWEKLSLLKNSFPLEVAEYAIAQGIECEPGFNWWVRPTMNKRNSIISSVNRCRSMDKKRTHKWGIQVPPTVKEALALDKANKNTLWADAIAKEMENVRVAFNVLPDGEDPPPGYQFVRCHMIFDIKMEDFRRKARLVAGGHMTDAPPTITYASVISRESVRIALLLAALNDLEVKAADIMNAYITAPVEEKIWTILGPEFGADQGKKAIIVRAIYGLKSSGASFRNHLADCMRHMGYTPCLADPDLWMKPEIREDGFEYYAYVLCYVDDVLSISHNAEEVLNRLDKYFRIKPGSLGDPDIYLGAKLKKMRLPNGVEAWALSPARYVHQSVKNVEEYISKHLGDRWKLPSRAENPFTINYHPEMDTTPELKPALTTYYQSQVGVLRWMVELGRVDINTEVSMLASQMALPREGHLEAVFHIFAYLKRKYNSRMVFDPTYPNINEGDFKTCNWKQFYGECKEPIPPNAPTPRGKEVDIRMFVDSDHAGDKATRRSRTGFLIYINTALIQWLSKKQSTVETSVFGAEFVAMKHGIEVLRGLRYKLRMMGVSISGPTFIYGDNMSVIHNTQRPESTLKKKSNAICYHAVRESVAMGESLTAHIPTDRNVADLLTKLLYGQRRKSLVSEILFDIYDYD